MTFVSTKRLWIGVTALFFCVPLFVSAGFGVSPGSIVEERAVPGASFTRVIYLVQGNPTVPAQINIEVESRDIKEWITFSSGTTLTIPTGVQQFPLPVTITIPSDAPFGIYSAFIRVTTVPDLAQGSGAVAVALGGRVDVEVTVGNDIVEAFDIKTISIPDITEREVPHLLVTVANTGNVAAIPDSASFELFDKFGNIRLGFASVSFDTFEKTPAFSEKQYRVEFPMNIVLARGEYWGHARVYEDDGTVMRELKTPFNVYEGENILSERTRDFLDAQSGIARAGIVFILLALLLFILIWVIRRKRVPQTYE